MRFVVMGDIHVYDLRPPLRKLVGKRLLGQLNLWFHRRQRFQSHRLPAVIDRVRTINPDMVLFTGDLTTTSLDGEFEMARLALAPVLERYEAFVLPGNHDRYTRSADRDRRFERYFEKWSATGWPMVRVLPGGVHLIGLDATHANWFTARGDLPTKQLELLGAALAAIEPNTPVIVMCHYPIGVPPQFPAESPTHRLRNQASLCQVLRESKHEVLYLHGHVHEPWCWRLDAARNVVTVNAGAPVMVERDYPAGQGVWEIECDGAAAGGESRWRLTHHVPMVDGGWAANRTAWPN